MHEKEENSNPYLPEHARIVRKYNLSSDVRFFQIRYVDMDRALTMKYLPGQFMMFSVPGVGEAPFSISSTPSRPGLLEFCIREVGDVTSALFKLKENAIIGIRGPYGDGFPLDDIQGHDLLIIVGGLGAAPLRSLLLYALDNRDDFGKLYLLHGARTPEDMLFREEFLEMMERDDLNCLLAVDEDPTGKWKCHIARVTDLFDHVKDIDIENTYAAVCGPPVMYKFVLEKLVNIGIPKNQILMTLERRMKCGMGKCGHCVVGDIYTCMEGPVFSYWDVLNMKGLI
ncbi:FAD/NAD(P)-binding protein [bacterium]|nr:FAD/NAD(P)-binding protein [bacterium]